MNATTSEFSIPQKMISDRRSPVRWLTSHTLRHWYFLLLAFMGALINAALASLGPVLIGIAFNAILASPPQSERLLPLAIAIGVSQAVRGVMQLFRNGGFEWIAQRVERDIRDELYVSLLGKSMTFHSLQPVGDTMARATNDVREINLMFNPGLNLVIGSANFLIMPVVVSPSYHPSLIIVPLAFVVAYIAVLWFYLRELSPIADEVRLAFGDLNRHVTESIDGIEVVKGAAQERREEDRSLMKNNRFRAIFVKQGNVEGRFLALLFLGLVNALGFLHAIILMQRGLLDIGQVVGYIGLLQLFGFPTFVSVFSYSQVSLGLASARRILEIINRQTDLDQNLGGYAGKMRGEIEFQDVCFTYEGNGDGALCQDASLKDISFKIKPGQTVAVVGQTGSGKTTLAKLVNRTYDVTGGRITIDGVDVRDWNLENLRSQISIIEQDIFLFSRSIAHNISFGKPDARRGEIETAAKAAQAHEFIRDFEDGYETVIGDRGVTLSGGQRQRIALARAFLTDPGILILDDSTSSIDSQTEDMIQQAIYAAARGRSTIIITHRLSQIRWADLIVVLRKGAIEAVGSHQELMKSSPAYRRIFANIEP